MSHSFKQNLSTNRINSSYFEHRALNCEKVRPRKVNFQFTDNIPCLWLDNSIVMTHFFNALNLYLPAFELFMSRVMLPSVTAYSNRRTS